MAFSLRLRVLTVIGATFLLMVWTFNAGADTPPREVKNSLGMEFTLLPAGTFTMGSPVDEAMRGQGETSHHVTLTHPFYMQVTEVTLDQWRALMGSGFLFRWRGDGDKPATKVSWYDIQEFIKKLNALGEGTYRLPTEAEWEYAARAGTTSAYPWNGPIDCANAMYANSVSKFDGCVSYLKKRGLPTDGPAPVKSYPPNAWGLYDMQGNVWEWVADWFAPYTGRPETNPTGPVSGTDRVRRGGSWFSPGFTCRSANRAYGHPASRLRTTGFRLVRELDK